MINLFNMDLEDNVLSNDDKWKRRKGGRFAGDQTVSSKRP